VDRSGEWLHAGYVREPLGPAHMTVRSRRTFSDGVTPARYTPARRALAQPPGIRSQSERGRGRAKALSQMLLKRPR
jgi:hypothetical protein